MAELNLDYYTAKDHYSDGDIEETLLKMAQEGKSFEDLPEDEVSFPMVYHFSGLRENILSWYPLKETDSVLEIGAGCGAITGMLCRKAGHVTSVELSKRRADINYARNNDKENLTIMVGNLNDMTFPEKFDYVVVNGVLEYAMSFTEGKTPYETFLQRMGAYLKPEGRLLIAIENRLGLKYFAGAPEDHTDLHFFGINGYPGNQSVRTFSKNELGELLENSGFPFLHFYYPYPDYKFPTEIFTDESLYTNSYGRNYPVYTDKTADLFSEHAGVKAFEKEKILSSFVNSFLVEAGRTERQEKEEILYLLRKRGFRVTKQRELILDIVFEHECASCKEIYYQAIQRDPGIGMATVYRMVNTLTDIGVLKVATLKPQTALGSGSGCQILLKNQNKIVLNQTEWTEVLQNVLRRKGYNYNAADEIVEVTIQ